MEEGSAEEAVTEGMQHGDEGPRDAAAVAEEAAAAEGASSVAEEGAR